MTTLDTYLRESVVRTEYAMLASQIDACLCVKPQAPRDANYWRGFRTAQPSDHGYNYSMGVGDCWSVHVLQSSVMGDGSIWYGTQCKPGNSYNYGAPGYVEPHYPVPALADTPMVCMLGHYLPAKERYALAWDERWIDDTCAIHVLPLDWYFT
jgi:hypothetical protein